MAAQYAEAPLVIRTEAPLRDALRKLAEQDGTNVSEFLRRELRAIVARKMAKASEGGCGGKGGLQ